MRTGKKRKILVLNAGSSSLKYRLFSIHDFSALATGLVEEIGSARAGASLTFADEESGRHEIRVGRDIPGHREAIEIMFGMLMEGGVLSDMSELAGIGHRVVHGGERFHQPVMIDKDVMSAIEALVPLAPLHNSANLAGIRLASEHAPTVPQVAVFDTAFHQTVPDYGFLYALPYGLYREQGVRRYGFHGTSHAYVCKKAADYLGRPLAELDIISLHLGNGASATAVQGGKSVDTSMGMTPLEGLIMGTRSGDVDPAILFYLSRETGVTMEELDLMLNRESGLRGICGESDMRGIVMAVEAGDRQARLALDMFCYRIRKYIGAYMAVLGGADCIVFTGGIGENSPVVREMACRGLERLGVVLDHGKNSALRGRTGGIGAGDGNVAVLVIPTDEELEIARQTWQVISR